MRPALPALLVAVIVIAVRAAPALDVGALPLRPGEVWPQPGQRALTQIESMPSRVVTCPSCGYGVDWPEADKLMRRAADGTAVAWTMHAESRDADLCPWPGKGRVGYQADIVVCPSCGFAGRAADYQTAMSLPLAAWAKATLRPNIRAVQTALLGVRAKEMTDAQIVDFFNRQEDIPDTVRTEHYRVYLLASGASALAQAEASWLAAWAARRDHAGRPKGSFLAKHDAAVTDAALKEGQRRPERADPLAALTWLLGKNRAGKERLPQYGDRLAARLAIASLQARRGFYQPATETLRQVADDMAERFLRADQDPFWAHTSSRASRTARLAEIESIRREVEAEVRARLDLMAEEQTHLTAASDRLRLALLDGELNGKPEEALFHAYLMGEFLRRQGDFPLAAEWFKNLILLAGADSPLRRAAEHQLHLLGEQAGETVNLLAALGQDGEAFAALRNIVGNTGAPR